MRSKVFADATSALAGLLADGMTMMAGGFGLCGIPEMMIAAVRDSDVRNLTFISTTIAGSTISAWGCCWPTARSGR